MESPLHETNNMGKEIVYESGSTDREVDSMKIININLKKKKTIKADEMPVKQFFCDDEEGNESFLLNNDNKLIHKFNRQRTIQIQNLQKQKRNSIIIYKEHLQKKSTMEQSSKKKNVSININNEDVNNKDDNLIKENKQKKRVTFPKKNFVVYIDIESYKEYYNDDSFKLPYWDDRVKCDTFNCDNKCCIIY